MSPIIPFKYSFSNPFVHFHQRENAIEYLTVRFDDLDATICGMDGRLLKLENDNKLHTENPQKKQSLNNEEKDDEKPPGGKAEVVPKHKIK